METASDFAYTEPFTENLGFIKYNYIMIKKSKIIQTNSVLGLGLFDRGPTEMYQVEHDNAVGIRAKLEDVGAV